MALRWLLALPAFLSRNAAWLALASEVSGRSLAILLAVQLRSRSRVSEFYAPPSFPPGPGRRPTAVAGLAGGCGSTLRLVVLAVAFSTVFTGAADASESASSLPGRSAGSLAGRHTLEQLAMRARAAYREGRKDSGDGLVS